MGIINSLYKLYKHQTTKTGLHFAHSRKEDEEFINGFNEPLNDVQRSYQQYLCQKWMDDSPWRYVLSNLGAMLLLIPFAIKFGRKEKPQIGNKFDAVVTIEFLKWKLPNDFYGTVACQDFNKGSLVKEDKKYISEMRKQYPFAFYFRFKCLCRIASYSDAIRRFDPKIIFSSAEYSFTSSVLTWYCEQHGVVHENVMHGEKLYLPREAFSRFTKFYVWDEFYINLFHSLRADKTEYIVTPINVPEVDIELSNTKCVYYLGLETEDELLRIKDALENLGKEYYVRPHPVYDTPATRRVFSDDHIQDCKSVDIWDSIAHAGLAISIYSTVIYQAYLAGVQIMIDDVSDPTLYHDLFERDYIMLNKPHLLLSEASNKKELQ